ncbi:hypothetical protein [Alteromonas oceanisediminis]|uniref:hypothetical protein n=1 Tax=Alteromonas oceanisediminis TaxID=2836180 RepID=UPI001BD9AC15|nr:hypothetical protein [Alteromonas oceanisediminis]MBT0587971.1 hypothetical protein [Alteromonas oceanisediminis]
MELNSISDFEQVKKGTKILVSDSSPQPPKHHKRKLATWQCNNYTGFFWGAGHSCGRFEVRIAVNPSGFLVNCYNAQGRHTFTVVEAA